MLTLLTATGCRPEAWALCERWMARQTYAGPVRWVIVDDGEEPQPVTFERAGWTLEVVRPEPYWQQGQNTQGRNLAAGLACIDDRDRLVIVEDDDWYAPDWLEVVSSRLDRYELAGETRARYYNVPLRVGREISNERHASLCATAMTRQGIKALRQHLAEKWIDLKLWQEPIRKHLFSGHRVVGIKGLPGRGGIGTGHKDTFTGQRDAGGKLLRQWIGEDAALYLKGQP